MCNIDCLWIRNMSLYKHVNADEEKSREEKYKKAKNEFDHIREAAKMAKITGIQFSGIFMLIL